MSHHTAFIVDDRCESKEKGERINLSHFSGSRHSGNRRLEAEAAVAPLYTGYEQAVQHDAYSAAAVENH